MLRIALLTEMRTRAWGRLSQYPQVFCVSTKAQSMVHGAVISRDDRISLCNYRCNRVLKMDEDMRECYTNGEA
eukprot:10011074-Karenia_brevis.AAC.1